jgi:hypothetical protein
MKNFFDELHMYFLFDLTQILISRKFEKEIVFESSVLAWIRIRIEQTCWIRIRIRKKSIHNPGGRYDLLHISLPLKYTGTILITLLCLKLFLFDFLNPNYVLYDTAQFSRQCTKLLFNSSQSVNHPPLPSPIPHKSSAVLRIRDVLSRIRIRKFLIPDPDPKFFVLSRIQNHTLKVGCKFTFFLLFMVSRAKSKSWA